MNKTELARRVFHSLIKGYYPNEYIVLNDGCFLAYIYATSNEDAIQKFNEGVYKK